MPDSTDLIPSPAAAKPDPEMPPRKSLVGGGKLRKPLTGKLRAAAEERLGQLRVRFRLHPLDAPPPSLSDASSPHEAALRSLGLLDFARLGLQSEPPRPDLVAQLIAYYDPAQHRSFVWNNRLAVSRTDLARALSLPPRPAPTASPPADVDPAALVAAVQEFMRVYVLAPFDGDETCILPPEVAAAHQAVTDESAHRVDWAGLIWGLVEKEILELPKRGDGVCYFGQYLQRLIWTQKPDLFDLQEEEEKGKVALVVSLDTDIDEDDGDADVGGQSLDQVEEPRDSNADVRRNLVEASEIEGSPLRNNNLDEPELDDADADTRSKISEEPELKGASLRNNDLDVLEPGDADGDTKSKLLEESKIEDDLESGDAVDDKIEDELESGDAVADMSTKVISEESKIDDAPLRSTNLDELESGDVDLRSMGMGDSELGDVDANARSMISEASMVADEDAKGMDLDEPKVGDELGLGFVAPEPLEVIHEARTSNDEVPGEMLCGGDEGVSVSPAQEDGSQSAEMVLTTQEEVLPVSQEDGEEECEEENGTAGWAVGMSSANDDDSMDAEENASVPSVENVDVSDSDNEEGEESEQNGFEEYRGGVEMGLGWRMEDENGGEGATNCFPGMRFENLNKGDVLSFDDGFSDKLGSLHGMESTNLLQAMNSIPAAYNGTENAHDLPSGEFLAIGADAHKNGVDLGTGSSFFYGNNGKRHIGDIVGYNDQMEPQQQFLQGNQQKRARNCNDSVSSGSAFFKANISDPIHNLLLKASISYEQKEREAEEERSQKQYMSNLLQEKDAIIQSLNSARFEQENKYQAKLRCFEHDLNVMGQLVGGYKKALKQSQASFSEYRKKFPSNKFRYHDVPSSGGLVVSVNELERRRQEEEQQKLAAATVMIQDFEREWLSKFEGWTECIAFWCSKTEGLAREIDLLKEKRVAKVATLAVEE